MLKAIDVRKTKPLGCLENGVENNVLNKQKPLTVDQFFKNDNI